MAKQDPQRLLRRILGIRRAAAGGAGIAADVRLRRLEQRRDRLGIAEARGLEQVWRDYGGAHDTPPFPMPAIAHIGQ